MTESADVVDPNPPWLTIITTAYLGLFAGAYVANHDVVCLPATSAVPVLAAIGIWPSGKSLNWLSAVPLTGHLRQRVLQERQRALA